MKERIRGLLLLGYKLADLAALSFALWLAFLYGGPEGVAYIENAISQPTLDSTVFFSGILISWAFVLSSFWLYRSKRLASWSDEIGDVIRAVLFCSLVLATLILLAEWRVFPKRFMLTFAIISSLLMLAIRVFKRRLLREFRVHGRNLRSVVVIGAGPRGQGMVELINNNPEIGYEFIGFVDDLETPGVLGAPTTKESTTGEFLGQNVQAPLLHER